MIKKRRTLINIVNSNSFKTVLFVLVLASVVKIMMNKVWGAEWSSILLEKQFTRGQSTVLYYGILAAVLFLYFMTVREQKRWKHIIIMALIPVGVYVDFLRYQVKWVYYTSTIMAIVLVALELWLALDFVKYDLRLLEDSIEKKQVIKDFVCSMVWYASKTVGGIIVYAMILTLYAAGLSKSVAEENTREPIAYATNVRDLQSTTPTNLWEPNKESLRLLAEDVYCTLDTQQRLNALQELVNIECEYLGVEPCQLIMEEFEDNSTGGYYRDKDRVISINKYYVEKDDSLYGMHILLHEAYHCYQHECVRNYQAMKDSGMEIDMSLKYFRDCASWEKDFDNYYSCNDTENFADYYQYAAQSVETAADEYRDIWLGVYWEYVNEIGKDEKTTEEVLQEVD